MFGSRGFRLAVYRGTHVSNCKGASIHQRVLALTLGHNDHVRQQDRRCFSQTSIRGAKRKSSIKVEDLPQGLLPLEPLPIEVKDGVESYPTVVLQARTHMRKFENCVLLTRVGGFYELYFEHATEFGPLLNLKVAKKKTLAGPVPMLAGFPFFQLDRFLKVLVQDLNRYVAIAEEFPNDPKTTTKLGGLLHDRKVSRIITPGTLIDENFMDPYANNYVLSILPQAAEGLNLQEDESNLEQISITGSEQGSLLVGLAWLDLSTGDFFTQSTTLSQLSSNLSRIRPREIVMDETFKNSSVDHILLSILAEERHLITYCPAAALTTIEEWSPMLEVELPKIAQEEFTSEEVSAGSLLLQYVETRLRGVSMRLQRPVRYHGREIMSIDRNTVRGLEINQTIRNGFSTGSLLHSVRRTVTKGGTRRLNDRLSAPSTSVDVINDRLNLVDRMLHDVVFRHRIVMLLKSCHDSQRLVQKFALGRGDPDDLILLGKTIFANQEISFALQEVKLTDETSLNAAAVGSLAELSARLQLDEPMALANKIRDAIDEQGVVEKHRMEENKAGTMMALAEDVANSEGSTDDVVSVTKGRGKKKATSLREFYSEDKEPWIMKPSASQSLLFMHEQLDNFENEKEKLNRELMEKLGAKTLSLRWTPALGYICHIKGKDMRSLTEIRSVSSSKSTRSFYHSDWTHLGQKMDQAKAVIRAEEQRVFQKLREEVVCNLVKLRRNAAVLDELDIACSFATLAEEQSLVRPILNQSNIHKIIGGRHPTVQDGLQQHGRTFVSNDCFVGDRERLWLITGPNMAGKSTFLRQNALITIMAQVGSYVPAEYAEIGIVDQIFSRIGSADDLYGDQSTFMVEMLETAAILTKATPKSFVIMDEIGRGTTPEDGTAIAYACLHHLYHVNRCRTLFATHFHDLTTMSESMEEVGYYCTDVVEDDDGGFSYVHRLRKGVNRNSHALKVAKLAGLPEAAIGIARQILEK